MGKKICWSKKELYRVIRVYVRMGAIETIVFWGISYYCIEFAPTIPKESKISGTKNKLHPQCEILNATPVNLILKTCAERAYVLMYSNEVVKIHSKSF